MTPRTRHLCASALLLAITLIAQAKANATTPAWQAWRAGDYAQAQALYQRQGGHAGQMGAGAAAWKLKDFGAASRHFSAALLLARDDRERLDALYNLGGAHYGLGHWRAAVEAYQAVLLARPGDTRASANLAEAQRQAGRFRDDDPAASDLRGRRGQLMQGQVNLDWDSDNAVKELDPTPAGVQVDRNRPAGAARLRAAAPSPAEKAEADARRLQSGLKKLELLEDRPKTLLQGLLKQDAASDGPAPELAPW